MASIASAAQPKARHSRRLLLATALLTPLLAACGTGFQAQTNQIYQPGPGISERGSDVDAINMLVVTDGSGNGTLVAALINQRAQPDTLESVAMKNTAGKALTTTILSSTIALAPQKAVQLANTSDVRVAGSLVAGTYASITLTFQHGAPISTMIPIVAMSSVYKDVVTGPVPPPTTPSHSNP